MLRAHLPETIIISLFVVLSVIYSLVTPVFEASDELSHYPVVQYIATHWQLPVQHPGVETLWEQEGSQPPLYYAISAALTSWIDTSDLPLVRDRNPHAKLGITLDTDNKNMILHTEAEAFPWKGTVLAVHLLRFFSIVLGALSVYLCFRLAQEIWPDPPEIAIVTAGLVAFNPMFVFITASVNNDNLTITLASLVLLILVRVLKTGLTRKRTIVLAIAAALAALTKISGLTLYPAAGVVLAVVWWRTRDWRPVFAAGSLITAALLIIAGWWYLRNIQLYGELLGTTMQVTIAGGRSITLIDLILNESHGFWVSYWACFGSVDILADAPVYWFYGALTAAAAAGLGVWLWRAIRAHTWDGLLIPAVLSLQILVTLVGLIRWTLTTMASQGRLMFPVIGALSLFTARGLVSVVPRRAINLTSLAMVATLAAITAVAPFRYIAPTYALPPDVSEVPAGATPVGAHWDGVELVAVETPLATVTEADWVPITLYWRLDAPVKTNYSVFLHALGQDNQEIGKIDSYPGGGALPTTRMQPGVIIKDIYRVPLAKKFATPTRVKMLIGMGIFDGKNYQVLPTTKADGSSFGNVVVDAGVAYPLEASSCQVIRPAQAREMGRLGDFAQVWTDMQDRSARPGDDLQVSLYWDRVGSTPNDWTVFVQMVGSDGMILSQADSPPLNNDYPTSLWRLPCEIHDIHTLHIPDNAQPGDYQILIGLYNPGDPAYPRAPAISAGGAPYPNNAIAIAHIRVEAR